MPRKRKCESEAGTERRNPSRKARPRENFAVEEISEPVARRGPKTIDVRRLMEVGSATHYICINLRLRIHAAPYSSHVQYV